MFGIPEIEVAYFDMVLCVFCGDLQLKHLFFGNIFIFSFNFKIIRKSENLLTLETLLKKDFKIWYFK